MCVSVCVCVCVCVCVSVCVCGGVNCAGAKQPRRVTGPGGLAWPGGDEAPLAVPPHRPLFNFRPGPFYPPACPTPHLPPSPLSDRPTPSALPPIRSYQPHAPTFFSRSCRTGAHCSPEPSDELGGPFWGGEPPGSFSTCGARPNRVSRGESHRESHRNHIGII